MRTASRGGDAPPAAQTAQETAKVFEAVGVSPQVAVADPETALASTVEALNNIPSAPTPLPEVAAQITNSFAVVSPAEEKPQHERPARPRVAIPRSGPVIIPVDVAAELAEFEGAYSVNADTRNDPKKMALFLDSVGFNVLVQWIEANPQAWKTAQIVGFALEEAQGREGGA